MLKNSLEDTRNESDRKATKQAFHSPDSFRAMPESLLPGQDTWASIRTSRPILPQTQNKGRWHSLGIAILVRRIAIGIPVKLSVGY